MMTQTAAKSTESVNELRSEQSGWFFALSMGLSIFMGLFWVLGHRNWSNEIANSDSKIVQTGIAFLTEYSFPFELTGVFLLIALVGATFIAKNHG
jgi:NADH:ubiquinone oxidoreductase subunit 6 (subunit J)